MAMGSAFLSQVIYIEERLANDRNYTLEKDTIDDGICELMNTTDPDFITQQEIAGELATWTMINQALCFLPVAVLAPFYGVLSDRFGRKLSFALPFLSHVIYCIIAILTVRHHLPLAFLAFGNFVLGVGGYFTFFLNSCYAYISDISSENKRLVRIAIVTTTNIFSIAFVQIPISYLLEVSKSAAFLMSLVFAILGIIYLVTPGLLLDTVKTGDRSHKRSISFKEILQTIRALFAVNTQGRRTRLLLLFVMFFLTDIFQLSSGAGTIFGLYGLGPPFCWSPTTMAFFNIVMLVSTAIGKCSK